MKKNSTKKRLVFKFMKKRINKPDKFQLKSNENQLIKQISFHLENYFNKDCGHRVGSGLLSRNSIVIKGEFCTD